MWPSQEPLSPEPLVQLVLLYNKRSQTHSINQQISYAHEVSGSGIHWKWLIYPMMLNVSVGKTQISWGWNHLVTHMFGTWGGMAKGSAYLGASTCDFSMWFVLFTAWHLGCKMSIWGWTFQEDLLGLCWPFMTSPCKHHFWHIWAVQILLDSGGETLTAYINKKKIQKNLGPNCETPFFLHGSWILFNLLWAMHLFQHFLVSYWWQVD